MKKLSSAPLKSRGFALVVTLSLMILLTLIAVRLLSLSAVSGTKLFARLSGVSAP